MANFAENLAQVKERLGVNPGGANFLVPTGFAVGDNCNESGQNLGALAVLWDASERHITVGEALPMFGQYLDDVVQTPDGKDHANIRALMGIDRGAYVESVVRFDQNPIVPRSVIDGMWDNRAEITPKSDGTAVDLVIEGLDCGALRVAYKRGTGWETDQTLKKAVLLYFRLHPNDHSHAGEMAYFDKVPNKFRTMGQARLAASGVRVVPPAVARHGSFIAKNVVLMPSYVNIGAYVDEGTMVDTWATVGSCAQIGKNVHLSGGVGIGGVLEPLQANPTIIEDNCFIGARSEVVEGVVVSEGSVLGMGVFLGQSTPVWDRQSRTWLDASNGLKIPPYSVVISGQKPAKNPDDPTTYCAVIVKQVDAGTRAKTSINELLRDWESLTSFLVVMTT
jgi:2,3,4,5-tetrahydropyridine-2-carboxylate N-succinyltransferase